jgi:hypothetical protein
VWSENSPTPIGEARFVFLLCRVEAEYPLVIGTS